MVQRTKWTAVRLLPTPERTVKMNFESYTYRWAITLLLCFALFHGAWGSCPPPPNMPNTTPVKETSGAPGDTVVYTCDRDTGYYEIPGKSTTITCQDDGTWTTLEEFCKRACGVPPRLDYAAPSDDALDQNIFPPGTNVTYNCRPGYVRIPRSRTLTCQEDYTWSTPSEPFCTRRSCGNPGDIENGEMHAEDFLFGSRVAYTCNEGYRMISRRAYRDCQADGSWSNAPPECEVVICPAPSLTSDLTIEPQKDEYSYMDSVTFSCRKSLAVAGNKSAHCTIDGTWSSDVPTCKAVNCLNPEVANSRRLSGFVGPYTLDSAISFECNKYFVLKGAPTIICNIDSEWIPGIPECKKVSCGNPGTLQNGHIDYPNDLLGATATYTCSKGYVLVPSVKVRTCQANEMWSGSAPSCEAICEEPKTPPFASRIEQPSEFYFNGTVVRFSCGRGFEKSTDKKNTITCQGHSWSAPEEFCRRISCGDPGKIPNGHVSVPDYLFGSKAEYTCEEGYERNTTVDFRECQADGKWSGAISCREIKSALGVGAIIGIVIAALAVLCCIFVACRLCKKKQKRGKLEPKVEYSHCSA